MKVCFFATEQGLDDKWNILSHSYNPASKQLSTDKRLTQTGLTEDIALGLLTKYHAGGGRCLFPGDRAVVINAVDGKSQAVILHSDGVVEKASRVFDSAADITAFAGVNIAADKIAKDEGIPLFRDNFSETVIPKMCTVVEDPTRIESEGLVPLFPGASRAILVEAFDQILVEAQAPAGFERGMSSFVEKRQLDPFAQTKFLGHNAVHAWLGYLAESEGLVLMSEVGKRDDLMRRALDVFEKEVGPGLIHAHARTGDSLFTNDGMQAYARDALQRMVNPFLNDPIERVTRDPVRKLGWEDRLIGSMRLAIEAGVTPVLLAEGAQLALERAAMETQSSPEKVLADIWPKHLGKEERQGILSLLLS